MTLKDFYEDIVSLDQMEGFRSFEDISINEYTRTTINVKNLETKAIENCYVYKYVDENDKSFNSHAIYIPHGDWKKYMNSL